MATATITPVQRRHERYGLREEKPLVVRVEFLGDDGVVETVGRILDISSGGAKLHTEVTIPAETEILLHLESTEAASRPPIFETCGRVCWTRPMSDLAWWAGTQFIEELPQRVLNRLAEEGYLERRQDPRMPCHFEATARWELMPGTADCEVLDFSVGGFLIETNAQATVGDRLLIQRRDASPDEAPIAGKIRWQAPTNDGRFRIGCSFVTKDGYPTFREQIAQIQTDEETATPRRRSSFIVIAGIIAVAVTSLWIIKTNAAQRSAANSSVDAVVGAGAEPDINP